MRDRGESSCGPSRGGLGNQRLPLRTDFCRGPEMLHRSRVLRITIQQKQYTISGTVYQAPKWCRCVFLILRVSAICLRTLQTLDAERGAEQDNCDERAISNNIFGDF